jgi:hypothetical protein
MPFLTVVLGEAKPDLLRWTGVHVADLATARAMHKDFFPNVISRRHTPLAGRWG